MNTRLISSCLLAAFATLAPLQAQADADAGAAFGDCLQNLRSQAASHGYPATTLDRAFAGIEFRPRIVELDRQQPEFMQTFWQYFQGRVTQQRVDRGRQMLSQHRELLNRIHADYGVRPEYIVALWGMETNYGSFFGRTPVLDALATLACDGRRADFFTEQFMHALQIVDEGSIEPAAMRGSWAGAMGHTQFMPSTFTAYAVDYDGNGRRDLWNSLPDAFASSANYLSRIGWNDNQRWGREVRLPAEFDWSLSGLDTRKPLTEWQRLGVRQANGRPLPVVAGMEASLLLPAGHRGPAFLVYDNFRTIMRWNYSTSYALAVGHLADRIVGAGTLVAQAPSEVQPLSRAEVKEIQHRLSELGFLDGSIDGIAGSQTRAAARDFQRQAGLPADGYADHRLLEKLRL